MQKIMFNDKYGLTQAVLEGRKTQTRRIAFKQNGFIVIEDKDIHLQKLDNGQCSCLLGDYKFITAKYRIGETLAIAQKYEDLIKDDDFYRLCGIHGMPLECIKYEKGCKNKMFVKADLMPNRIRITDIRAERLQEISDEDCIAEGIREQYFYSGEEEPDFEGYSYYAKNVLKPLFCTPRETYAALIDKISGKGTWVSNPYVFVYEFELIK